MCRKSVKWRKQALSQREIETRWVQIGKVGKIKSIELINTSRQKNAIHFVLHHQSKQLKILSDLILKFPWRYLKHWMNLSILLVNLKCCRLLMLNPLFVTAPAVQDQGPHLNVKISNQKVASPILSNDGNIQSSGFDFNFLFTMIWREMLLAFLKIGLN